MSTQAFFTHRYTDGQSKRGTDCICELIEVGSDEVPDAGYDRYWLSSNASFKSFSHLVRIVRKQSAAAQNSQTSSGWLDPE